MRYTGQHDIGDVQEPGKLPSPNTAYCGLAQGVVLCRASHLALGAGAWAGTCEERVPDGVLE